MHRPLTQIIFHITNKADRFDIIPPVFLQVRFGLVMNGAHEPEFRVFELEPVPRFQKVMNAFALDQRARKNHPKNRRRTPGLKRSVSTPRGR